MSTETKNIYWPGGDGRRTPPRPRNMGPVGTRNGAGKRSMTARKKAWLIIGTSKRTQPDAWRTLGITSGSSAKGGFAQMISAGRFQPCKSALSVRVQNPGARAFSGEANASHVGKGTPWKWAAPVMWTMSSA